MDINSIEQYLTEIQEAEKNFRRQNIITFNRESFLRRFIKQCCYLILSIFDIINLYFLLRFRKNIIRNKIIVYTGLNSCVEVNGKLEDRIVRSFFYDNIIFINTQKNTRIKKINNQKVFNIGTTARFISLLFFRNHSKRFRIFYAYKFLNELILRNLKGNEVYLICLWEMNTLSVIFSKYRSHFKLIKIQHGSMIDYPPYIKPAPVKVADLIYVRNKPTIDFLKSHLCSIYPTEYKLIPYPEKNLKYFPGLHILYASTIETNGFHPVFIKFLQQNQESDLHVKIRLHPREISRINFFKESLRNYKGNFEFDYSKNWIESNNIKNLIVISPWSTVLEEAYDNGFVAITIDPVGKIRFQYYIDNKQFFYSENIAETISLIRKIIPEIT